MRRSNPARHPERIPSDQRESREKLKGRIQQFFKRIPKNPFVWFTDNFHTVEPSKCYRSKTLSFHRLEQRIRKHGIATILNVREADATATWYQQELSLAKKYGITLHTVTLNERVVPSEEQIQKILTIFNSSAQPLLIHCRAGADRTGLVSALWVLEQKKGSLQEALAQQRLWFGHIKWLYPKMRQFIVQWYRLKI